MPITLVVEDGSGLANANSYLTVDMADAYHEMRANTDWADADVEEKKGALVRATAALDTKYRGRWPGQKAHAVQALAWPRSKTIDKDEPLPHPDGGSIPTNSVPVEVRNAVAEVALIELTTRFLPQAINADNAVKREKVDVVEVEYRDDAPMVTTYPYIDAMLRGLVDGDPNQGEWTMRVSLTQRELAAQQCDTDYLSDPRYFIQG